MIKLSQLNGWILSISLVYLFCKSNESLLAQSNQEAHLEMHSSTHVECLYSHYKVTLDSFYLSKIQAQSKQLDARSNNGRFELRIYVDTSYERRRTGVYNRNDSVTAYLNKLVDSIEWMFNVAAPNWDVDIETEILFFDTATPFSYGSSASETLINFYDWLDAQGFPGLEDNYVLYSGNFTNQGISFVGELCNPGVSMVGYVSSFVPNVDLSSHEWVGHSANSLHYNTEVNIMNSFASRPWNSPSLQVIQNYLDNQLCIANAQSPLALSFDWISVKVVDDIAVLDWSFDSNEDLEGYTILRRYQNQDWIEIYNGNLFYSYFDRLKEHGKYYYRMQANLKNQKHILSAIQAIDYKVEGTVFIEDIKILNPEYKLISVFDFMGRLLFQSKESTIDLSDLKKYQNVLILYDQKMIKYNLIE